MVTAAVSIYVIGIFATLAYNLYDMVFVSNWLTIIRNAIFWPIFLPVLIALRQR
jgi:hypothetical protein